MRSELKYISISMNPLSAALYGYSLFSFLKNRKGDQTGNNASMSPNRLRSLLEAKVKYLTFQRDTIHNLKYDFIRIIDTRFWYQKGMLGTYFSTGALTVKNTTKDTTISIYGVIVDWKIGSLYSKCPLFTVKPALIKPGQTEDIIMCSMPFEHMYKEDGTEFTVDISYLNKNIDWNDKEHTESVEEVVSLNTGIFIYLNNRELAYRELDPYDCKIKLNEVVYNLEDLRKYTGYSKNGTSNFNLLRLWKAKGYNGIPFTIPDSSVVISDKEYDRLTGEYKNVQE